MRCLPHRAAGLCLRSLPTQRNIHFIYYLYIESVSSCLFFEMDVCSPVPRSFACYDTKLILCVRQLSIDPLSKQTCYMATTKLWPLDGTTSPRWSFFLFTLWCFVVGTLAALTRALCRSGTMLARLFMEEVRVNERAPSAGVAYCTPPRLGRSRVEYFLSISLCIMLGVGLHALCARVRHSHICFTSKRLLLLRVLRHFGCVRGLSSLSLHPLSCQA